MGTAPLSHHLFFFFFDFFDELAPPAPVALVDAGAVPSGSHCRSCCSVVSVSIAVTNIAWANLPVLPRGPSYTLRPDNGNLIH